MWYHSIDCEWFPISVLVTLSIKCTAFEIFDFKNAATLNFENRVRGPSMSLKMSPYSIERI